MPSYDCPASPPQAIEDCYPAANPYPPHGEQIAVEEIIRPSGVLTARLYQTHRTGGRRITVHDQWNRLRFDSGDQYDLANATNALDLWLSEF